MTEIALLAETVDVALSRLPAVRRVYPARPAALIHGLAARIAHTSGSTVTVARQEGRARVEVSVGLSMQRPAVPAALEVISAVRAALAEAGETEATIRLRVASID